MDFSPPWLGRGISKEITAAVEDGWFAPGAPALDIGCGQGEVAGWLAEHGHPTIGFDIAPAVIARARASNGEVPGRLEFHVLDVCGDPLPDWQFRILIDRGCLHQLISNDYPAYLRNVLKVSAPDARMLLFVKAFRRGQTFGDPEERKQVTRWVEAALGRGFKILRVEDTYLDPYDGKLAAKVLPGMVFWLIRR